ncbi:GNAT family N-acetyltransferase [Salinispira pacifica]|nr:GNAT family N-acetyltransferase [Salinispira pacifica]
MDFIMISTMDESKAVAALARNVFGPGSGLIVPSKPKWGIYARNDAGKMVGGVILKRIGKKAGMIDFIFVDAAGRGQGLGPELLRRGLDELVSAGCEDQLALIRDDNTPSWNMFARQGFTIPSWFRGVYPYSLFGFVYLFFLTFANTGYSLWLRSDMVNVSSDAIDEQTEHGSGPLGGILLSLLIAMIAAVGVGRFGQAGWEWFISAAGLIIGTVLLRIVFSFPFARAYGKLRFQNAHGGGPWSVGLGLLGAWWPHFGMWVPRQKIWHFSRFKGFEGRAALAAWMATLTVYAATYLVPWPGIAQGLRELFTPVLIYQALPFIPFEGMDGYRVFKWSRGWYAVGLVATIVLIALRFF